MQSVHILPPTLPAFLDESRSSPIYEFALRVVVEFPGWQFVVVGTAVLISTHLAITARHVLEHVLQTYGAARTTDPDTGKDVFEAGRYEVKLYQVLPGPAYRIWRMCTAWVSNADLAVLHLNLAGWTSGVEEVVPKSLRLRGLSPPVGETVIAFGYRQGQVTVTEGTDGVHHINLDDRPTTSIGKIREVYPSGRDRGLLPFPCFEIEAQFDPGMSGGLVMDEAGRVCGLVCASLKQDDPNATPISYVTSLWPMLGLTISADRAGSFPKGVSYPMIDLAIDGIISVVDLHELDPALFPGKQLAPRSPPTS